jgi:hypothetical protein
VTSTRQQLVDSKSGAARRRPSNIAAALGQSLTTRAMQLGEGAEWTWPSMQYQRDPVAYCREVLGTEPWGCQRDVMQALVPALARVAVKSGHKTGKSHLAACIALWFYCSFANARVVMSSTTSRQVDRILWRELRMMHYRSQAGLREDDRALQRNPHLRTRPIGGEPAVLARSGLVSPDFREITGFTAREAEAVAGISGENLLYIIDEASGVPGNIFEAIQGNMAGGARILLLSNPTQDKGEFFDAFGKKAKSDTNPTGYTCFTISSEMSPNVVEGRVVIPGLATREWIETMRQDYGPDSAWYTVRVKGDFVLNEASKIISLALISAAEQRWEDAPEDGGQLHIGLDPAGPSGGGDETVFCLRRGGKILSFHAFREQNEDAILVQLIGIVQQARRPREVPLVKVDREGLIGSKVFGRLRAYLDAQPAYERPFECVGVRASDKAHRDPMNFDRMRDELWENMRLWLASGGAIPPSSKLEQELHAPDWVTRLDLKRKVTPKEELRKLLGRSCDHADAMALAVWDITLREHAAAVPDQSHQPPPAYAEPAALDPYDWERAFRR